MTEQALESFHGGQSVMPVAPGELLQALEKADIRIGGTRPWDIRFNKPNVFERVLAKGSLGLGEAYVDGDWDVTRIDMLFDKVLTAELDREFRPLHLAFHALRARLFNLQNIKRAWQVGEQHYDLGNEFYSAMLDPRMT
jgi:cyclopropane-fatty-acyl-phospholipid synthase